MRTRKGAAKTQARKRLLKKAKGYVGGRRRLVRSRKETLVRAGAFAFVGRKNKKREYRRLWIIRLNAACRERGLRYSEFINGLGKVNVEINRKMLSEMAIREPQAFDAVFALVKNALSVAA
jgi:large subunit ribosomal protein L20